MKNLLDEPIKILLAFLIALLVLSFIPTSHSEEPQIQYVEKGKIMPYDGYAINPEMEKKFRRINEEKLLLSDKVLQLETIRRIEEMEIGYFKENFYNTREELEKQQSRAVWIGGAAFVGGILTTVGIGWLILLAIP